MLSESERALRYLAHAMREAAVRANRPDVAAKAGEIMAMLGEPDPAAQSDGRTANIVIRILDGLGL